MTEYSAGSEQVESFELKGLRAGIQLTIRFAIIKAITFVALIPLARLLSPADFGTYAIVLLVVTLTTFVGDLGLSAAVVQRTDDLTRSERSTAWWGQITIWLGLVLLCWAAAPVFAAFLLPDVSDSVTQVRTISLSLVFVGLRALPASIMVRSLEFGRLAGIEIVQQLVFVTVAICAALLGLGSWSFVCAVLAHAIVGAVLVNASIRIGWPTSFSWATLRPLLSFGIGAQVTGILAWGRDAIVPFGGGILAGTQAVGFLAFAWRNAQVVTSMEEMVARVALPTYSRLRMDRARLSSSVERPLLVMAGTVGYLQGLLVILAPPLIVLLFSPAWKDSVVPFQCFAGAGILAMPIRFWRAVLIATGRTKDSSAAAVVSLAFIACGFVLGMLAAGINGAAFGFACGTAISTWIHGRLAGHVVRIDVLKTTITLGIPTSVAGIAAITTSSQGMTMTALIAGVYVVIAGTLLYIVLRPRPDDVRSLWRKVMGGGLLPHA